MSNRTQKLTAMLGMVFVFIVMQGGIAFFMKDLPELIWVGYAAAFGAIWFLLPIFMGREAKGQRNLIMVGSTLLVVAFLYFGRYLIMVETIEFLGLLTYFTGIVLAIFPLGLAAQMPSFQDVAPVSLVDTLNHGIAMVNHDYVYRLPAPQMGKK